MSPNAVESCTLLDVRARVGDAAGTGSRTQIGDGILDDSSVNGPSVVDVDVDEIEDENVRTLLTSSLHPHRCSIL